MPCSPCLRVGHLSEDTEPLFRLAKLISSCKWGRRLARHRSLIPLKARRRRQTWKKGLVARSIIVSVHFERSRRSSAEGVGRKPPLIFWGGWAIAFPNWRRHGKATLAAGRRNTRFGQAILFDFIFKRRSILTVSKADHSYWQTPPLRNLRQPGESPPTKSRPALLFSGCGEKRREQGKTFQSSNSRSS